MTGRRPFARRLPVPAQHEPWHPLTLVTWWRLFWE